MICTPSAHGRGLLVGQRAAARTSGGAVRAGVERRCPRSRRAARWLTGGRSHGRPGSGQPAVWGNVCAPSGHRLLRPRTSSRTGPSARRPRCPGLAVPRAPAGSALPAQCCPPRPALPAQCCPPRAASPALPAQRSRPSAARPAQPVEQQLVQPVRTIGPPAGPAAARPACRGALACQRGRTCRRAGIWAPVGGRRQLWQFAASCNQLQAARRPLLSHALFSFHSPPPCPAALIGGGTGGSGLRFGWAGRSGQGGD